MLAARQHAQGHVLLAAFSPTRLDGATHLPASLPHSPALSPPSLDLSLSRPTAAAAAVHYHRSHRRRFALLESPSAPPSSLLPLR